MRACLLLLLGLAALPGAAQPFLRLKNPILNAAGFQPRGVPGSGIAQGSIFSIFGSRLGPASPVQQTSYPLQTTLGGVSVTVTQGNTTVSAIPAVVLNSQINAIMPSNAPLGLVSVTVTYNGQTSNPATARVVANSPGLFTFTGFGIGPGAIQNVAADGSQPPNAPSLSAKPGQIVTLWATGLGPVTVPDTASPPVGNLPFQVEIFVGGQPATNILYSGRSACCSSIDQIAFQVPANAPSGCYVPVVVRVAGSAISNTVTMAIDPGGAACSDSFNPISSVLVSGGTIGVVSLEHHVDTEDLRVSPALNVTSDRGVAYFGKYAGGLYSFNPFISLPPPGTCTTYVSRGELDLNLGKTPATDLDPGALSVTAPGGTNKMSLARVTEGSTFNFGLLGLTPALPRVPAAPLYLNPGTYSVSALGSTAIGSFSANVNVAAPPTWTNRDQVALVTRSKGLTLNWTGGGLIYIYGTNRNVPEDATGAFACTVPSGATTFTVPPYVVSALPESHSILSNSQGYIELHSVSGAPVQIQAANLTYGIALSDSVSRRSAAFQ